MDEAGAKDKTAARPRSRSQRQQAVGLVHTSPARLAQLTIRPSRRSRARSGAGGTTARQPLARDEPVCHLAAQVAGEQIEGWRPSPTLAFPPDAGPSAPGRDDPPRPPARGPRPLRLTMVHLTGRRRSRCPGSASSQSRDELTARSSFAPRPAPTSAFIFSSSLSTWLCEAICASSRSSCVWPPVVTSSRCPRRSARPWPGRAPASPRSSRGPLDRLAGVLPSGRRCRSPPRRS